MVSQPTTSLPQRPASGIGHLVRSRSGSSKPGSKASDEDSKTAVKVAVRVRPPLRPDDPGLALIPHRFQRPLVFVNDATSLSVEAPQGRKLFVLDRVFGGDVQQDGVWNYIAESIDSFLQGYNVSVMAYGQSGAGKSFTMGTSGPIEQADKQMMGIVPRAAAKLFEHLQPNATSGRPASGIRQPNRFSMSQLPTAAHARPSAGTEHKTWQMKASYVEIYNEQLRDLLVPENTPVSERAPIAIREDPKGRIFLTGLIQLDINSIDDLLNALNFGSSIRQTDATTINAKSSRSHAIFSLNLVQKKAKDTVGRSKRMSMPVGSAAAEESIVVDSKLHFVDLAGSERMKNTGASGERAKEGISINAGLASLGKVIAQLSTRHAYVSYRDSKLTRMLQDSLGGNAMTYMIACVNPAEFHLSETLNTIQYAQRARNIQSKPKIQQVLDDSGKDEMIERLRTENKALRDQLQSARDGGDAASLATLERPSDKEIDLQNQVLDLQESNNNLAKRHAKLAAEMTKVQDATSDELKRSSGEDPLERVQRGEAMSQLVETTMLEYTRTITRLEQHLDNQRTALSHQDAKLNERENHSARLEATIEQLQVRIQTLMDREKTSELCIRDLEDRVQGKNVAKEQITVTLDDLRKEVSYLRDKDNYSEGLINTLEIDLRDAKQGVDVMQSEVSRLERVVDRQRDIGKQDGVLHRADLKQSENTDTHSLSLQPIDEDEVALRLAVQTPVPNEWETDEEIGELKKFSTVLGPIRASTTVVEKAMKQLFLEDKLATVNQELFDLRMEHDSTVNDHNQLAAKYENAMGALNALKDKKGSEEESAHSSALKSEAGMKGQKGFGQDSSSRSLSLELSSAGERLGSREHSEALVQGNETPITDDASDYGDEISSNNSDKIEKSSDTSELQRMAVQKDAEIQRLQQTYDELNEKLMDKQDEIEELKAEVTKAKMSNPPSPTSQFLRRKSSQNVMSIDRAHRSLASLGNIAGENFADHPEIKDQFELHINAIMHELHHRSERVSVLENEMANIKKEMDNKMTIISGLTRERSSMKAQSPVDVSMFTSMRDQVLQSEAQLGQSETRNKELTDELESLKRAIEISAAEHKAASAASSEALVKAEADVAAALAACDIERQKSGDATSALYTLQEQLAEHKAASHASSETLEKTKEEVAAALEAYENERQKHTDATSALETLKEQLAEHQDSVESYRQDIKSMRDSHVAELDAARVAATKQQRENTEARFEELSTKYNDQVTKLRGEIEELEDTLQQQKHQLDSKVARISLLEQEHGKIHSRNASNASDIDELQQKMDAAHQHKTVLEQALTENRAKFEELSAAKEQIAQELSQVREREQRASRLVDELEEQLQLQFKEGQQATSRLSHMQSTRDQELTEARAAAAKAQEEISTLNKRLSQLESHRGSMQSTNMDQPSNTVRKTNSVQSLPSPPPAIPLPPLPKEAPNSTTNGEGKEGADQRIEDQEARIRTIEKHLFAEKQLTATLEEALTDIEKDGKKVKGELESWKKKCWEYEDELGTLREERKSNRDSLQAVETEKARRLKAERAQAALEERMATINKKKKKSTLNCF